MDFIVRRARAEDAEIISDFAARLVRQHQEYDPDRFASLSGHRDMSGFYGSQINRKNAALLVAEANEKVIGFAYVHYEDENYVDVLASAAWLHDFYIDERVRQNGVGKKLLDEAVAAAKKMGANKVMLTVAAQNQAAQHLFARRGFQVTMQEMMLNLTDSEDLDR